MLIDGAPAVVFVVASDVVLEVCALFFALRFLVKGFEKATVTPLLWTGMVRIIKNGVTHVLLPSVTPYIRKLR